MDRQIPEMPSASTVNETDLLHLRQGATDKKLTIQTLQNNLATIANIQEDQFSGNGVAKTFTLTSSIASATALWVVIGGVPQRASSYSINGKNITFTQAPPIGTNNIWIRNALAGNITTPADGSVTRAKTDNTYYNDLKIGRKNLFINGDCSIDQRNDGAVVTYGGTGGQYIADRLFIRSSVDSGGSGTMKTAQGTSSLELALGGTYAEFNITSATSYQVFSERVEITPTATANKTLTLQAQMNTPACDLRLYVVSNFGSGGSPEVVAVNDALVSSGASGSYGIEHSFNIGNIAEGSTIGDGAYLEVVIIATASGSASRNEAVPDGTYRIGQRQLEFGNQATEFEYVSDNLQRCQRYYLNNVQDVVLTLAATSSNARYSTVQFPVTMRATPFIITVDGLAVYTQETEQGFRMEYDAGNTTSVITSTGYSADAEL